MLQNICNIQCVAIYILSVSCFVYSLMAFFSPELFAPIGSNWSFTISCVSIYIYMFMYILECSLMSRNFHVRHVQPGIHFL